MPRNSRKKSRKSRRSGRSRKTGLVLVNTRKYVSSNLETNFASVGTTWIVEDVCQIAGGTDMVNRIARRCHLTKGHLALTIAGGQSNLVTDDVYNAVRFVVVLASDTLVAADWANILLRTPPIIGLWPKVRRFLIDKTVVCSVYGPDSVGYVEKVIRRETTFPVNLTLDWDGTGATDHSSTTLYFAMITDSAAVSHPGLVGPSIITMGFSDGR